MQDLKLQLEQAIKELYDFDFDSELTPSPDNIDADYSSNAPLRLAKELHKPPMEIASELEAFISGKGGFRSAAARDIAREPHGDGRERRDPVTDINVSAPGFLNFTLSDDYLTEKINDLARDFQNSISSDKYKDQTVICEFSDPNPFKVLHVGHLYTSIVGDSISRLFEYAGAKVIRANYGGDVGLHVAKTMYILQQQDTKDLTIEDVAKCYVAGTAAYEDDEAAHRDITKLNKEIYQINTKDIHDTEVAKLYWLGRKLSYDYFRDFYDSIGVKFDKYYPESTVAPLGLETVNKELKKGIYEKSDGAVIFNGEKYGLHTRVFINREGVPTYEAKDVGLVFTKWNDYHFDKSIIITGSEQLEYMKVVYKSIEQYAPDLVERTSHLTHGLVKLPGNMKMSSRKGNFLKAVDVIDMVKDVLHSEYNSTDDEVSLGAIKYAFLKYKMGGNIIFDPKESVKMTGNSGPYLLYSCVRAKKILASANNAFEEHICRRGKYGATEARNDGPEGAFRKSIIVDAERNLAKKILEYKSILAEAVSEMAPHKLANYLYELAQVFSRFYEACPVNNSEREKERLTIVKAYLETMAHGLDILGINIPEEM